MWRTSNFYFFNSPESLLYKRKKPQPFKLRELHDDEWTTLSSEEFPSHKCGMYNNFSLCRRKCSSMQNISDFPQELKHDLNILINCYQWNAIFEHIYQMLLLFSSIQKHFKICIATFIFYEGGSSQVF